MDQGFWKKTAGKLDTGVLGKTSLLKQGSFMQNFHNWRSKLVTI